MKENEIKFSIIIPVYNVEKYLKKCIESVLNQSYKNYEVIIINDGSTDESQKIIDSYKNNTKIKTILQKNKGLSISRNEGIKKVTGDYILFLDSDDFYEQDLLRTLNDNLEDTPDVLRFQVKDIKDDEIIEYKEQGFETTDGIEAFKIIRNYHYVEPACIYCYNTKFWKNNKFKYMDNCIAEDFGLTPYIIYKSSKIKSIEYIGYNYLKRANSIMNDNNYNKKIKKTEDMLLQAKNLKKKFNNQKDSSIFISFINDSIIYQITTLNKKDYKKYKKILLNEHYFDYIETNTIKRKIKKMIIKASPWFFYKVMKRYL